MPLDLTSCHLQDILVKHKALTIISRSQKKKPEKLISFPQKE